MKITNCFFDPSNTCTIGSNDSYTFSRRGVTSISSSYYTAALGNAQGEFIGLLTLPDGVTASAAEEDTVSYDKKTWFIGGRIVTLTVTPPEGFVLAANGLSVSWTDEDNAEHDVTVTQGTGDEADKWRFEMPDHNVTVTAVFERAFGTPDFTLPEGLTTIEESAFEGVAGMTIVDASNCSSIGKDAFKDCTNLMQIRLPKDCEIDPAAFDHPVYVFAPDLGTTKQCCDEQENLIFAGKIATK